MLTQISNLMTAANAGIIRFFSDRTGGDDLAAGQKRLMTDGWL